MTKQGEAGYWRVKAHYFTSRFLAGTDTDSAVSMRAVVPAPHTALDARSGNQRSTMKHGWRAGSEATHLCPLRSSRRTWTTLRPRWRDGCDLDVARQPTNQRKTVFALSLAQPQLSRPFAREAVRRSQLGWGGRRSHGGSARDPLER
jgi:hypothetical protein